MSDAALVWIGIETTGLSEPHDCVLEVACLVTDIHLDEVDEHRFRAVVGYGPERAKEMEREASPAVRALHRRTGLWREVATATTTLGQVEADLVRFINERTGWADVRFMAGSTVAYSRRFIDAQMPRVAELLHRRMVDVSSLSILVEGTRGRGVNRTSAQGALSGINESLEELRIYWEPVRQLLLDNPRSFAFAPPRAAESRPPVAA